MALKPDREELTQDISFYMKEVAQRGGIATISTVGDGSGWVTIMGDKKNVVTYAAAPSGKVPAGILMNDMVTPIKGALPNSGGADEMPVGGKCCLLRRGWVHTNMIAGTPTGGGAAYVGASGLISATQAAGAVQIGQFLTTKDPDGYARVSVLL